MYVWLARCRQSELIVEQVRYNALSRNIENALQKDGIPNRIVGGHKFFDRLEVKDLLAYLHLVENPGFTVSLSHSGPSRLMMSSAGICPRSKYTSARHRRQGASAFVGKKGSG